MNILISFVSGLVAAFTPCVVVLFPLILYRFYNEQRLNAKKFALFSLFFIFGFFVLGLGFTTVLDSAFQNGFKLGLGILFVVLGLLSLTDRINPLQLPFIKNTALFGLLFALIITINPCVIPYLGALVSFSNPGLITLQMLLFALGLLFPLLLFGIVGQRLFSRLQKHSQKVLHSINKLMSVVLVGAGIYLVVSIYELGRLDLYILVAILVLIYAIIIRSYFIVNRFKDLRRPDVLVLLGSFLIIIIGILLHCSSVMTPAGSEETTGQYGFEEVQMCQAEGSNILSCDICRRCILISAGALVFGFIGVILSYKDRYAPKEKD